MFPLGGTGRYRRAVDRFLRKATKRNDPLETFRATENYKKFEAEIVAGMIAQAKYAAAHISEAKIWQEGQTKTQIEAAASSWLDKHLPPLADYLNYDTVHACLYNAFIWCIQANYERLGLRITKAVDPTEPFDFTLTNKHYINALKDDASYLLNTKSKGYDQTTKSQMVNLIRDRRMVSDTIDELGDQITKQFGEAGVSSYRGFMIANTETARAFGSANNAFMGENGVEKKQWVTAGGNPCADCLSNEDQGPIPVDDNFDSGDATEPAHPNCECYIEAVMPDLGSMSQEELDSLVLWDGS